VHCSVCCNLAFNLNNRALDTDNLQQRIFELTSENGTLRHDMAEQAQMLATARTIAEAAAAARRASNSGSETDTSKRDNAEVLLRELEKADETRRKRRNNGMLRSTGNAVAVHPIVYMLY
jgi:hypothetical protein